MLQLSIWCCGAAQATQPALRRLVLTGAQQEHLRNRRLPDMPHQAASCLELACQGCLQQAATAAASQGLVKVLVKFAPAQVLPCRPPRLMQGTRIVGLSQMHSK